MASIFRPSVSLNLRPEVTYLNLSTKERFEFQKKSVTKQRLSLRFCSLKANKAQGSSVEGISAVEEKELTNKTDYGVVGVHHVGLLCENLERSLEFYQNILGLEINEARPHDKLPYRGAWLWVGSEMIHLMELPNPDPLTGRPEHGGRDRHACIAIRDVSNLKEILDKAGIEYTMSKSGRPAIFTRDPDANALEFTQI
ncbi:hypothetical protein CARUB_v10027172mg [Capsella rubella]|uniref:VOC domain-containing protein n=1 Tax=Capsella rubella TaxID=81985 RepID=R0GSA7_9BRAS|nr:uncharacterized protein LOC17876479 [Capsella rubella]EOA14038.1 hypothetical protein CARUB_v10027172mg [Capsella rubella]